MGKSSIIQSFSTICHFPQSAPEDLSQVAVPLLPRATCGCRLARERWSNWWTLVINCSCWPRLEFPLSANPDQTQISWNVLYQFLWHSAETINGPSTTTRRHESFMAVDFLLHLPHTLTVEITGETMASSVADRNHWMIGYVFVFSLKPFFSRHLFLSCELFCFHLLS